MKDNYSSELNRRLFAALEEVREGLLEAHKNDLPQVKVMALRYLLDLVGDSLDLIPEHFPEEGLHARGLALYKPEHPSE